MVFDIFVGLLLVAVIGIQYLMIHTYQKRLDWQERQIKALAKYKEDKGHMHKLLQGDLVLEHDGKEMRCKATLHPRIMI
mgnify:CR=1 FL=1